MWMRSNEHHRSEQPFVTKKFLRSDFDGDVREAESEKGNSPKAKVPSDFCLQKRRTSIAFLFLTSI